MEEQEYKSLVPDLMSPEEYKEYAKAINRWNDPVEQERENAAARQRVKREDRRLGMKIIGYPMACMFGISMACLAIGKACESPDEGKQAISLEDKCNELNREKPRVDFQGHSYRLQCEQGNPVLYEE